MRLRAFVSQTACIVEQRTPQSIPRKLTDGAVRGLRCCSRVSKQQAPTAHLRQTKPIKTETARATARAFALL